MSKLGNFVWGIADQLRGVYKPHQYGGVILPFTILRRLDCILEPTRDDVRTLATKYAGGALDVQVKRKTGLGFYNTSHYDFTRLLEDPEGLRANLMDYLTGFSANIDVFERFKFEHELATLDEKNRLYLVTSKFAEVDLHPDTVSNAEMGDLFEHLIYKFAEASNEEAGEHYTPRDAIRLIVDLLFAEDNEALLEPGTVRTIYDPTAGTGGMLSVAEERLLERNPQARLRLFGQEINDQSYAICKSDMIAKGQDATNVRLGDTLADDLFWDKTFDFCMSNPPYGVDWKAAEHSVKKEALTQGSRFSHGLPAVGDGQMLFLSHLAHKMRPAHEGGGRAGIVLNGSPLFNGAAESGPSKIRQWLLESDLVEAIVALPTNMFFNTGIATYIWILDNTKHTERAGKIQLIDATSFWTKMRKNLGAKSREIDADGREKILALYDAFDEADSDYSKIFIANDFAYWTITIERPLLDEHGKPITDRKGTPKPDAKKRDTENIPFTYGGNTNGDAGRAETIKAYFENEVLPHVPDAWIDTKKTKVGYEIPFTRHFYKYVPPRPLAEIDADLEKQVAKILTLLREVEK
ncbi:type I restriction-modification system subunit M [Nocardia terpenica]|uniref:site-specific DNA-methyltransferase (adenine-specific) n=1 Tax=Nocardia terpenica TaxID=455432 RepID=A0A291RC47_9NOCA|nr:class I SAM-dependent DNA methyltransferase [Nocardia terpenica]ATL65121.1 restriction endonuclease subunit M [Nocardia terpenica]